LGIIGARLYYVAFEWGRYAGKPLLEILNPQGGGLAIHGAIVGALLAVLIYTRREHLPLLVWLDICVPTLLVGQAIGRWGNFFNQEAYGRPTTLPWSLDIAPEHRIPPYDNLQQYPPSTRFHPTFLYESLWNAGALVLILWVERRFRGWLKPGDSALLYGVLYSAGRFFTEGLRTDSLCVGPYTLDGSCAGGLRIAQLISLAALVICGSLLAWRHRRSAGQGGEPVAASRDLDITNIPGSQRLQSPYPLQPHALRQRRALRRSLRAVLRNMSGASGMRRSTASPARWFSDQSGPKRMLGVG
jgi:phosphatidylglycerol:prolipoprotein diacylglycerol transferase